MTDWIKCSDRLPEEGKDVLVYFGMRNLDGIPKFEIASYRTFKNGSFFISGPYKIEDVSYWMPLPRGPHE